MKPGKEVLEGRVRAVRARALVRSWELRQRNLAAGVWFRMRRLLSDARAAYEITEEGAAQLLAMGVRVEPAGLGLAPPKTIVFVTPGQLETLQGTREIPVNLGAEFLAARHVALVAFERLRREQR